ncbi:hypothetical protein BDL97_08G153600, partial [Sphagnum fallax]
MGEKGAEEGWGRGLEGRDKQEGRGLKEKGEEAKKTEEGRGIGWQKEGKKGGGKGNERRRGKREEGRVKRRGGVKGKGE